jgi:hypothetical protein
MYDALIALKSLNERHPEPPEGGEGSRWGQRSFADHSLRE